MEEESHDFGLLVRRQRPRFASGRRAFSPLPSLALVKFWQGRVELALRILCVAVSCCCFTTSLFSLLALNFASTGEELVDSSRSESWKVVAWVMSTASVSILIELLVIGGRFLNFKFALSHSSLIQVLDVISTVLFTSAYLTLTIPLIVFSRSLSDFERLLPKLDSTVHFDSLKTRYYLNITLCSLCVAAFLTLSVWMSIYLSFNWDRKMNRHLHPVPPQSLEEPARTTTAEEEEEEVEEEVNSED